jgi:hypothetical protein
MDFRIPKNARFAAGETHFADRRKEKKKKVHKYSLVQ